MKSSRGPSVVLIQLHYECDPRTPIKSPSRLYALLMHGDSFPANTCSSRVVHCNSRVARIGIWVQCSRCTPRNFPDEECFPVVGELSICAISFTVYSMKHEAEGVNRGGETPMVDGSETTI